MTWHDNITLRCTDPVLNPWSLIRPYRQSDRDRHVEQREKDKCSLRHTRADNQSKRPTNQPTKTLIHAFSALGLPVTSQRKSIWPTEDDFERNKQSHWKTCICCRIEGEIGKFVWWAETVAKRKTLCKFSSYAHNIWTNWATLFFIRTTLFEPRLSVFFF